VLGGGRRLAIVLAAGGLLVSGCGESVSGSPSAAPPSAEDTSAEPDYPLADYEKPLVPVFRKLREIDPCALHDLEAAKRISPDLDSLAPGDSLGRCTLQGGKGELARSWSFVVEAGTLLPEGAPETIGEAQFRKQERNGTCQYVTPIGDVHGLSLQVQWGGTDRDQPPKPACDVAKEYLTATAARWKTPPKRSENRTQPALSLGLVDPCIAAKDLLGSSGGTVRLGMPNSCGIRTGGAKDKTDIGVDIQLQFGNDPTEQLKQSGTRYKPAEVKGKPAAVNESASRCTVTVQYSRDTMVKVDESKGDDPARNQVITVAAKTCDAAKTAADTVVGKIKPPAASQPAAGAMKLGDLNPPPSWQDVGAPADPCTVIGWDAFPPEARNPKGTKPTRRPPEKDSVFKAACRFEAGGADVTVDKDKATGSLKLLLALVVWGDDASGMSADPAKRPGSVAKDYGGKPGLEMASVDSQGNPECLGVVKTSRGNWGVSVTNAAFPGTQTCAISQSVMTAIAAKMP
jgi:hypothetical protein